MAQKVHIVLEDDLDGSDATQTVTFGLDGTSYEIDLNDKNAAALRDAMATYVGHARKVAGSRRGRRSSASSGSGTARGRSATGPGPTATRSPSAAGSRPAFARRSTRRTDPPAAGPSGQCWGWWRSAFLRSSSIGFMPRMLPGT